MKKKYLVAAGGVIVVLLLLRSCGQNTVEVVDRGAAPQIVAPAAPVVVHDNDNGGFLSGLMMGHIMNSGHSAYNSGRHTTVVNHYNTRRVTRNVYRSPKRYYGSKPSYRSRFYSRRSR